MFQDRRHPAKESVQALALVEAQRSERLLCDGLTWEVTGMICALLWPRENNRQVFSTLRLGL